MEIRAKHDIIQIAGIEGVFGDINTRYNGGTGRIFAFGASRFVGRLETERLFSNPFNNWPGRVFITESLEGTIVLGKSFTDPFQWMEIPPAVAERAGHHQCRQRPGRRLDVPGLPRRRRGQAAHHPRGPRLRDARGRPRRRRDRPRALRAPRRVVLAPERDGNHRRARHRGPAPPLRPRDDRPARTRCSSSADRSGAPARGRWCRSAGSRSRSIRSIRARSASPTASRAGSTTASRRRRTCGATCPPRPGVDWVEPYAVCIDEDETPCPADVFPDGTVDALDLLVLIAGWGTDDPKADTNDDGTVDALDLLALIAGWGPC